MKKIYIGIVALIMALSSIGCSEAKSSNGSDDIRTEDNKISSVNENVLDSSAEESQSKNDEPLFNNSKVIASGDCGENGDNVTWKLYEDGLLVIEGSGKMKDYPIDRGAIGGWGSSSNEMYTTPWKDYNEKIKKVVVTEGITYLGESAFSDTRLESLMLPDSLETISVYMGIGDLTSLRIPKGVKKIGGEYIDLYYAYNLETIEVDDENEYFSSVDGVLYNKDKTILLGCPPKKKSDVVVPYGVKTIGASAFANCQEIRKIDLPVTVNTIETSAFCGCIELSDVSLPEGLTSIRTNAFAGCKGLYSINIPSGLKSINSSVFSECSNLTNIVIPEGVEKIGSFLFNACKNLEYVTIPSSVTYIGLLVFDGCEKLTIKCHSGSYAEKYAKEHHLKYEYIG